MIRLKDTVHSNTSAFLSSAIRVAEYYGFVPLEDVVGRRAPAPMLRQTTDAQGGDSPRVSSKRNESEIQFARREEKALSVAARRCAIKARGIDQPLLVWRTSRGASRTGGMPAMMLELHVVGHSSTISEALLIIVADAIAAEAGVERRILSINNIGSFESSNRYLRDVSSYLRKHIETISQTLRPRVAADPLGTLVALIERGHPAVSRAPQAMEYLTEEERRRFWELLEYLEMSGLPYELSPLVLGSRDCWAHSLYEISTLDDETGARIGIAFGGRYDPLASRFAHTHLPSAMISISCEMRGRPRVKRASPGLPAIYYAHLGPEARRRSLFVLETLRKEGILVHQGLLFERIGEQMEVARRHATPYILIMGHKEAVEGTVLVREVATNSQEAVPLPELASYLKRHRVSSGLQLSAASN